MIKDKSLTSSETYYPEFENQRRSRLEIIYLQLNNIWKNGKPNKYFFVWGHDIKGLHNPEDYIDESVFLKRRNLLNRIERPDSSAAILRNKFYFGALAHYLNIPQPEEIGLVENGVIQILKERNTYGIDNYFQSFHCDAFLKAINGECGKGVYHLVSNMEGIFVDGTPIKPSALLELTAGKFFVLQKRLSQAREIANLHATSINTIRLVTVYNRKTSQIEILPPVLRIGADGSNVDNWAAGGLIVGIDLEKQCLKKYAFYKPNFKIEKCTHHPNSQIQFEGYSIPYLYDAIEMAKRFHSYMTDLVSIGWDIALTDKGPCFIEGNDNWDTVIPQVCHGGLRNDFDKLFYK